MKFLADECCSARFVANVRAAGHHVRYILEEDRGLTDRQVLAMAFAEKRILLTEDKDFGELVYRLKKAAVGIILLRFRPSQSNLKWQRFEELIQREDVRMIDHFIVVDADKFRIRPL